MSLPEQKVIDLAKEAGFSQKYIEDYLYNVGDLDLLQRQSINLICKNNEDLLNESYY